MRSIGKTATIRTLRLSYLLRGLGMVVVGVDTVLVAAPVVESLCGALAGGVDIFSVTGHPVKTKANDRWMVAALVISRVVEIQTTGGRTI